MNTSYIICVLPDYDRPIITKINLSLLPRKKIIALRKSVPKSDKRKKREVASRIADLEYELNKKHEEEVKVFKAKEAGLDPTEIQQSDELDDGISLDRLDELSLQEKKESIPVVSAQPTQKVKKVNKARLRIEKRNAEMERLRLEAEAEAMNQVDMATVETKAIQERILPLNLSIKPISADGHCLYNAFADQLKMRYNQNVDYKELRRSAAEYMRHHQDDFVPFLYLEDGTDFNKYCDDIENTACWGGQLEILALAKSKSVPVDIIQYDGPIIKICEDEYPEKPPIKLAYHKHLYSLGAHYNSLADKSTITAQD
ncbi:uncharacterized protein BX663DRAFT_544751 [Cokeromyces recurvatus]|uniref:uncharacterized protein n=1 Tax=Cokeromyces recurvatus TaxID=90255 RepID=UPI00221F63B2|nr:uncharacterized protein BX663DRAFT_544751 [Cokeromyces recurvatus]KAI7900586.1 hypothetical protein BX663DRAFT_544751 [Cokeromyces recurvatus]